MFVNSRNRLILVRRISKFQKDLFDGIISVDEVPYFVKVSPEPRSPPKPIS